jgi:hypothetical protein
MTLAQERAQEPHSDPVNRERDQGRHGQDERAREIHGREG